MANRNDRVRTLVLVALASSSVLVAAASCSLGLDESKITTGADAGADDGGGLVDGEALDGGDGGTNPVLPDGSTCAKNEDCTAAHACLKGKCDLSRKACVYEVCRPSACNAAACDQAANVCGEPKAYPFKAAQFDIGANVTASAIAVVHPWLFAHTANGVLAFNVSDPSNPTPAQVPVVGLGFVPAQMIASGSRVYLLAAAAGAAPSRLPLAWIDVPADPFATKITANTVLATYSRPAEAVGIAARTGSSALLIGPGGAASYPSSVVEPPLVEPVTITATPLVFTAGMAPASTSGSRLVMQSVNGAGIVTFGVIENAGSTTPQNAGNTAFQDAGPLALPQRFAVSSEGAVFWTIGALTGPANAIEPPPTTRALRGFFLLPDGTGALDQGSSFDVEVYAPGALGAGAGVAGPTAMLDANTAIVLAAASENTGQTAVQFATRQPLGLVKNADGNPRRVVLPVPVGSFAGAAGSNGVGYAVANRGGDDPNATVYVFDPACAP